MRQRSARIDASTLLPGLLVPLFYVATVAWGATLFAGYSHIADPISALTQSGRTGSEGVEALLLVYNVLVMAFAVAGIRLTRSSRAWLISFSLLLFTGLLGILMWLWPMDPIGAPISLTGVLHMVAAGLTSVSTMGAIGGSAVAWRAASADRPLSTYAWISLGIVLVSGLLAAAGAAGAWPVMGLLERITIGTFELWQLVTAAALIARQAKGAGPMGRPL